MRRIITILVTVIILGLVTFAGLEWMARVENKHADAVRFSSSLETSKKNNFFVADYHPISDTIKLSQHSGIILLDAVFAERGWRIDTSTFYLLSKKVPVDTYNMIINYSEIPPTKDINFDLAPLNDSSVNSGMVHYGNKLLLFRTPQLQDTVWFRLMEKTNDSIQSWIESDTVIGFTKK